MSVLAPFCKKPNQINTNSNSSVFCWNIKKLLEVNISNFYVNMCEGKKENASHDEYQYLKLVEQIIATGRYNRERWYDTET